LIKRDKGTHIREIIDVYPGEKQAGVPLAVKHQKTPFFGIFRWVWLWYRISMTRGRTVHINFSSASSLFFCLLPFRAGRKWVLTLHHGQLGIPNAIYRTLYAIALNRFETVIALSPLQREFYSSFGVEEIKNATSYIHYLDVSKAKTAIYSAWEAKSNDFKHLFVASGYPTSLYNHDQTVEFVTAHKNAFLALFIYGPDSEGLLKRLKSYGALENCIVFYNRSEAEFNDVLLKSNVYLRPNRIDSFGIAVADAVNMSLTVFASDVCERYPGAILFTTMDEYRSLIDECVKNSAISQNPPGSHIDSFDIFIGTYGGTI
jgi:hypothetical protein